MMILFNSFKIRSLWVFLVILGIFSGGESLASPQKTKIDDFAKANGFPESNYPFYMHENGCGASGIAKHVPDQWGNFSFTQACNGHDRCFMVLNSNNDACNELFYEDLKAACEIDSNLQFSWFGETLIDTLAIAACRRIAGIYYAVVQAYSLAWHRETQAETKRYYTLIQPFIRPSKPA